MTSKVYGASDDLIEFEGDIHGEIGCYATDDKDNLGVLIAFSDGTIATVRYGKNGHAVWGITVLRRGELFACLAPCLGAGEGDGESSDVLHFRRGKLAAWWGRASELVP